MSPEEKVKLLEAEIAGLKAKNRNLEQYNYSLAQKAELCDKIISRQSRFKSRIEFVITFMRWLSPFSGVIGSFVRRVFELAFHLESFKKNNWIGETLSSNIDIVYCYSHELPNINKLNIVQCFYDRIDQLSSLIQDFAGWKFEKRERLDSVEGVIPTIRLYFNKEVDTIAVDIYAWKPKNLSNFSLTDFALSQKGIVAHSKDNYNTDFFSFLNNLINKQVSFVKSLEHEQDSAFPEFPVAREKKIKHINNIYNVISIPLLKLLECGYSLIGRHPEIEIEKKDDCSITGCKAPYPTVNLVCNHTLSLMAYKGIINTDNIFTEAIKCPFCRSDLKLKFKYTKESNPQILTLSKMNILPPQQHLTVSSFTSKEAFDCL
jgi:hypothetical protein